jgi:hypothetical protein
MFVFIYYKDLLLVENHFNLVKRNAASIDIGQDSEKRLLREKLASVHDNNFDETSIPTLLTGDLVMIRKCVVNVKKSQNTFFFSSFVSTQYHKSC